MKKYNTRFYGSTAVAKRVGISLRQLYYWVDKLHVIPLRLRRCGAREFRRFTSHDLKKLREMKRQVRRGFTIRAALRKVRGKR